MSALEEMTSTAVEAVEMAAEIVRTSSPGTVTVKGDRDMASDVDFQVERAVREHLARVTPAIGLLGEEDGLSGSGERYWALDPIDGTANFVKNIPLYGISLALVEEREPVVGAIALPYVPGAYHAARGEGAYHGGRRLVCSQTDDLRDAIVGIGDYSVGPDAARKNDARLAVTKRLAERAQRVRMLGTVAVDLAWLAEGRLDATIVLSNSPWDMAAGTLIAAEAGARVVDRDGSPHTLDSAVTIAATPSLLDDVLALVKDAEDAASSAV